MTDKQKVTASLTLVSETCTEALKFLIHPEEPTNDNDLMPVLHQDLISLLSLVYSSTTKLALALKPSSPDYPASLGPLRDIASHVSDLARCASLFNPTIHGATLTREIASVVKDVIESVRSLVLAFTGIESNGTRGAGKGWDEYMVRTGTVHDLIDKARGEDGLPKNNIDAVRKKWTQDKDSLDDGLRELGEMIEEAKASGEERGDRIEDGWDELGISPRMGMTKEELERSRTVYAILRLATLLHKRIFTDLLSSSPQSNLALDSFSIQSSALLLASDELISTMYTPQDSSAAANESASFLDVIKTLQADLDVFFSQNHILEAQLDNMSLSTNSSGEEMRTKKWFDTCFQQIHKAVGSLSSV